MKVVYSFIDSPISKAMGLSLNCWSICRKKKKKKWSPAKPDIHRKILLYKPEDEVSRFGCNKFHLSTSCHYVKGVHFFGYLDMAPPCLGNLNQF